MSSSSQKSPCRREDLPLYHYGEVTGADRARFEEHLNLCAACRQELREIQAALHLLPQAAPDLPPEVIRSFNERVGKRLPSAQPRRMILAWSLAASAALLLALTLVMPGQLPTFTPTGGAPQISMPTDDLPGFPDAQLLLDLELLEHLDMLQELRG